MTEEFYSEFYSEFYGSKAKIPNEELMLWLKRAAAELSRLTLGRSGSDKSEPVLTAVCEIAEAMYEYENRAHIRSENNDGYSVTYKDNGIDTEKIAKRYLSDTGLLYRGDDV